jgi:hypothetical protein
MQSLERHKRMLEDRLKRLERGENGLWQDLKADVQAVTEDLSGGIERWIERLDTNHAEHSPEPSGQPTSAR